MSNEQNKPGFTPGPWVWGSGWQDLPYAGDLDGEFEGPKYADLGLKGGGVEIIPLGVDHYEFILDACAVCQLAIREADRNLIAAAPDLYEALEIVVACDGPERVSLYEEDGVEGFKWTHPDGREWVEICDWSETPVHPLAAAALTKARGEQR